MVVGSEGTRLGLDSLSREGRKLGSWLRVAAGTVWGVDQRDEAWDWASDGTRRAVERVALGSGQGGDLVLLWVQEKKRKPK